MKWVTLVNSIDNSCLDKSQSPLVYFFSTGAGLTVLSPLSTSMFTRRKALSPNSASLRRHVKQKFVLLIQLITWAVFPHVLLGSPFYERVNLKSGIVKLRFMGRILVITKVQITGASLKRARNSLQGVE